MCSINLHVCAAHQQQREDQQGPSALLKELWVERVVGLHFPKVSVRGASLDIPKYSSSATSSCAIVCDMIEVSSDIITFDQLVRGYR